MSPAHQAVAEPLHAQARWFCRRRFIGDHIRELEDLEHALEQTLSPWAGDGEIRAAVLRLRQLLERAGELWGAGALDHAVEVAEQATLALAALRAASAQGGWIR
jgi:hypothetical protein